MTVDVLKRLNPSDQKAVVDMTALYASLDLQTQGFAEQTGLRCKSGCGACCENPHIEVTVAEVLPLAVHLWAAGRASSTLKNIQSKSSQGICVFYQPGSDGQGRCGIYGLRPGLCRLFGFSGRLDKHGRAVLVTCKIIKASQPQECSRTQQQLDQGLAAPLLGDYALQVSNIDPAAGQKLLPINQAVELALEKVGFRLENTGKKS